MPDSLSVVQTVAALRERVGAWRRAGQSVGLVPTMGYLHAGHMALAERSLAECNRTVASIFVNPAQFGENEDLDSYPRDLEGDLDQLRAAGVALALRARCVRNLPGRLFDNGYR